jgi:hypothetical protein
VDRADDAGLHPVHRLLAVGGAARFAPAKLLAATLVAIGLGAPVAGIAGAAVTTGICGVYLTRLAARSRRDPAGIAGFTTFGTSALALLVLYLVRMS